MKKLEQLALDEIKKNAHTINMELFNAASKLTALRDTLRHCEITKDGLTELIKTTIEALSNVEQSTASSKLIQSWAEGLAEK
jgi:hypothetical protein